MGLGGEGGNTRSRTPAQNQGCCKELLPAHTRAGGFKRPPQGSAPLWWPPESGACLAMPLGPAFQSHPPPQIVPGRVSTEVDAHLSHDATATYDKALRLVELYAKKGGRRAEGRR
jgi:hypothetical protein